MVSTAHFRHRKRERQFLRQVEPHKNPGGEVKMKKIPTLFKRNPDNMSQVTEDVHPDCLWVLAGEGVATRKFDGTCCMIKDEELYKRRELKRGQDFPPDFLVEDFDAITGKIVGWVPVDAMLKEDRWHFEAFVNLRNSATDYLLGDGTYELIGPKVQGNPEGICQHRLMSHREAPTYDDAPRTFDGLKEWLKDMDIEGLVWHHPDGRMAKIKLRDFGYKRMPHKVEV